MARVVSIGNQDFEHLRVNHCFYIDKTSFIKEWWESGDIVTLITRPRRFGKTLTMDMLEKFFSVQYAGRSELFEGLSIWEEEKYRDLQGTYPVIFLSFAGVKETTFTKIKQQICQLLSDFYRRQTYLLESNDLLDLEKEEYLNLCEKISEDFAPSAIRKMSEYMTRYYQKKPIILLDEYDTPLQEAYVNGYWTELVSFIRNLFNNTFKTNPYLERAIMTGITRISKESVFSDLNNLEVVTTTSRKYMSVFGFTEKEVFTSLEEFGLSDWKEKVKKWYNGFCFGTQKDIYNPWSMINLLDKKEIRSYWANTSSNSLAGKLIQEGSSQIKKEFEVLLQGGVIKASLDEQIIFNQLESDKNAVWSLLLASGYLKVVRYDLTEGEETYDLALTNKEVQKMFERIITGWFQNPSNNDAYNEFIKSLLAGDIKYMNRFMNEVALNSFSYFDTGKQLSKKTEPERFYHGFVLGLMVELADRYTLTSDREMRSSEHSSPGRYDVILEPKKEGEAAYILEFKVHDSEEEASLEETVQSALTQIEEKKYETMLTAKGMARANIRKYGFAFQGKNVLIGQNMC